MPKIPITENDRQFVYRILSRGPNGLGSTSFDLERLTTGEPTFITMDARSGSEFETLMEFDLVFIDGGNPPRIHAVIDDGDGSLSRFPFKKDPSAE